MCRLTPLSPEDVADLKLAITEAANGYVDDTSAVCRLTPLSPEEVADLKLAITEAANDFVDETPAGWRTRAG